jgi:hypothetical protein
MKNFIHFYFILLSITNYSQIKLDFDLSTMYSIEEGTNLENKSTELILTNSKNLNSSLNVRRNSKNKLIAIVRTKENVNHYFTIINENDDLLNSNNYKYEFSVKFNNNGCFTENRSFKVESVKDVENFNMKISAYESNNNKKLEQILYLEKVESEQFFYNNYKRGFLHHFDSCDKLIIEMRSIVKRSKIISSENKILQKTLLLNTDIVAFTLTIAKARFKSNFNILKFQ